jgi:UDP-N-acetylglucosamine 2-epimerase (non-hydrolysing)
VTKLIHVVAARPNFVKVAPVVDALRGTPGLTQVVVHTGQHYDTRLSDDVRADVGLPLPDRHLGVGSGTHAEQTAGTLIAFESVLHEEEPDMVVVAGDVNATLASALAAAKLAVPVAHIESGLRSGDWTMPEEINRVLVDQVASWCFTHSPEARENLVREGVPPERVHFVGNTMIDSLVRLRPRIDGSDVHARLALDQGGYVLVTLHRPRLVDGPLLQRALESLVRLSREVPVVFPLHPRTQARLAGTPNEAGLKLVDPVGYVDFLALEARAAAVITDSGGVQEETTFLRVPCFTLRETTERPITVSEGTNRLLGLDVERIEEVPGLLREGSIPLVSPALWDGHASARIVDALGPSLVSRRSKAEADREAV